jgi:hypothetical protein
MSILNKTYDGTPDSYLREMQHWRLTDYQCCVEYYARECSPFRLHDPFIDNTVAKNRYYNASDDVVKIIKEALRVFDVKEVYDDTTGKHLGQQIVFNPDDPKFIGAPAFFLNKSKGLLDGLGVKRILSAGLAVSYVASPEGNAGNRATIVLDCENEPDAGESKFTEIHIVFNCEPPILK